MSQISREYYFNTCYLEINNIFPKTNTVSSFDIAVSIMFPFSISSWSIYDEKWATSWFFRKFFEANVQKIRLLKVSQDLKDFLRLEPAISAYFLQLRIVKLDLRREHVFNIINLLIPGLKTFVRCFIKHLFFSL